MIILGTILLILPVSSNSGQFTSPIDALFTATSYCYFSCVRYRPSCRGYGDILEHLRSSSASGTFSNWRPGLYRGRYSSFIGHGRQVWTQGETALITHRWRASGVCSNRNSSITIIMEADKRQSETLRSISRSFITGSVARLDWDSCRLLPMNKNTTLDYRQYERFGVHY